MMSDKTDRLVVVGDVLEIARPLNELEAQLAALQWDYEGDGVQLTRQHLSNALRRYLDTTLSAESIERWANMIEGREDICFEENHEKSVEEVLHELANPALTQSLNQDRANMLLEILAS